MLLISNILYHKSLSIWQPNIFLCSWHLQVFCGEVTIHNYGSPKKPSGISHQELHECGEHDTYWSGWLLQSSGILIPGWGQAGQNSANEPFPGFVFKSCPKPNHFLFFKSRHWRDTLSSSRYRSYYQPTVCKMGETTNQIKGVLTGTVFGNVLEVNLFNLE